MRISDWSSDVCSSDLPGFYDGVAETPEALKAQWRGLGLDDTAFLAEIGLSLPAGERGRDLLERIWARPTCDVNGIWGGYTGEGSKTVIQIGRAHVCTPVTNAQLVCRLLLEKN